MCETSYFTAKVKGNVTSAFCFMINAPPVRDGDVPGRVVHPELGGALHRLLPAALPVLPVADAVVGGAAGVVGLVVGGGEEGGRAGGRVQLQRRHHVQQRVRGGETRARIPDTKTAFQS